MSRIKIIELNEYRFSVDIPVRITDINYGGHVGNDRYLAIMHEARMLFLEHLGLSELDIGGASVIMVDAVLNFKGECFYGDTLTMSIEVTNLQDKAFDLEYKGRTGNGRTVLLAKTTMLAFDYDTRKVVLVPASFKELVQKL